MSRRSTRTPVVTAAAAALLLAPVTLAACGGDTSDGTPADDAGTTGGPSGTLTVPSCADHDAYVRLTLTGPQGAELAWTATDFPECHGGTGLGDGASLQFDLGGDAGEGSFFVKLVGLEAVTVGAGLTAEVLLNLESRDLYLNWKDGCTAAITDVTAIDRFDNGGPYIGVWERYTGTVACTSTDRPLLGDGDYGLPEAAYQGISYRLEAR
ncbi:hypothetical protein L6V77_02535 [Myxococcota bacterium]|nr:hypothetical protein [Myxococcota bacterium]